MNENNDSLSGELWQRADQILDAALDLEAMARQEFVDRECAGQPELRELVSRLLRGIDMPSSLDGQRNPDTEEIPAPASPPSGGNDPRITAAGAVDGPLFADLTKQYGGGPAPLSTDPSEENAIIDKYRVVSELGRGGMAVVYLAERADGEFQQQVALKLIKRGVDTDEVLKHFGQERQIMARTSHPNIARLLDGGATDDGRPYFVMEHVEGVPIDQYCDKNNLSVRGRLELFLQVAQAVEYAHRNLVVHRDIKPNNILVSEAGEVKLLDFGIAKLVTPDDETVTKSKVRFMTPAFASPEQLLGDPVTTASDVYQLGLLLYTLLTGQSPFAIHESSDLARMITETPPPRPSTAIDDSIALRRNVSIRNLKRELQGDLDNIVLMALRKEPDRRYPSVAQFIEDLHRYKDGRPIGARPDTFSYRLSKLVGRYAAEVTAASVALLLVVALIVFYTSQLADERDRANLAAAESEEIATFLSGLFESSDPSIAHGEDLTARDILDRGAEELSELEARPATRASLMKTIGLVYRNLGLYEESEGLLADAMTLRDHSLEPLDPNRATIRAELAMLYRRLGRFDEAEALLLESLPIIEASEGPRSDLMGEVLNNLAIVYKDNGNWAEAEDLYLRAIDIIETNQSLSDANMAALYNNLALIYRTQHRTDEAEPLFKRALTLMEAELDENDPSLAVAANNLGLILRDQKKWDEAEPYYRRALAILEKVLGEDHPQVAVTLHNLGDLLADQDRHRDAAPLYERSYSILIGKLGPDHPNVATSLLSQGQMHTALGDIEQAEIAFLRALEIEEAVFGTKHPILVRTLNSYGEMLRIDGRPEEAAGYEARATEIRDKAELENEVESRNVAEEPDRQVESTS